MTPEMNLKELERKAWTAYFDDGILDITVGLFVLAFGIGMTTQYSSLAALAWMVIFFFAAAKKSITLPRVGLVKFSPEREERMKKEQLFFVIFFSITAFIGLAFFLALSSGIPQSVKTLVGELALIGYQLIIATAICLVGYWKQIRRFYAYTGFLLIAVVVGVFFDISGVNPLRIMMYQFTATGIIILLTGLFVLARFFKRYPRREGEEDVIR
ncbi:MAG: hypothetical protein HXS40_04965 [Theionarchaea archaeon]|nr:hypothetical protein [Theionarchaea archaeon]